MRWQDAYSDESDEDPFPKMLDDEPTNLLGPYVATEVGLVEKVKMHSSQSSTGKGIHMHIISHQYWMSAL